MAKGRKNDSRSFHDTVADKSAAQAILEKQDELIDAIKALTAKLDGDVGVTDVDYASVVSDAIVKVDLK